MDAKSTDKCPFKKAALGILRQKQWEDAVEMEKCGFRKWRGRDSPLEPEVRGVLTP